MSINYSLIILVDIVILFVTINLFRQADCGNGHGKLSTIKEQNRERKFPWVVGISEGKLTDKRLVRPRCSGSIISEEFILTAAHCQAEKRKEKYISLIDASKFFVRAGKENLGIPEPHEQNIQVAQWFRPPTYIYDSESKSQVHDIALIKLAKPLKFDDRVQPICLTSASDYKRITFGLNLGTKMTVIGWANHDDRYGYKTFDDKLGHVDVSITKSKDCAEKWSNSAFDIVSQICAKEREGNQSIKNGSKKSSAISSGGPLVWYDEQGGNWKVHGVLNYGHDSSNKQYGVHSKTHYHLKWLRDTIKKHKSKNSRFDDCTTKL